MEWGAREVSEFLIEIMNVNDEERAKDIEITIAKHHVTGVDLVEMNESNLMEIGIHKMHERKQVIRAIRQQRNDPHSTYGKFKVRMLNPMSQKF